MKRRSSEVELAEPKKKKRKRYEGIDFSEVTCWRINPNVVGELQLLNRLGAVLYTGPVQMSKTPKKLPNGYLDINNEKLRRDSRDTADLEKTVLLEVFIIIFPYALLIQKEIRINIQNMKILTFLT